VRRRVWARCGNSTNAFYECVKPKTPGSQFELLHSEFEHSRSCLRRRESSKNISRLLLSQKLRPKVMHLWSVFIDCIGHTCLNWLWTSVNCRLPPLDLTYSLSRQTDSSYHGSPKMSQNSDMNNKNFYRYSRIRDINISNRRESWRRLRLFWSGKLDVDRQANG